MRIRSVISRPLSVLATVLTIGTAPAIAAAQSIDSIQHVTPIPRSQRPIVAVMNFNFNATLSDDDRDELNSLGALASALRGGDPTARQTQSAANLGRGVADLLIAQLLETSQFRVLERTTLESVLGEQNLAASDRAVDSAKTVAQKTKLLGAQYLITGAITKFGHEKKSKSGAFAILSKAVGGVGVSENTYTIGLTARIVDASTGEVVASITSDGEVKGGRQFGVGGGGGGAAGLFGSSASGEKEKKIGEAVQAAVASLVGKLVQRRETG